MTAPWGCPNCGHAESWVKDTAYDEDGYIVRRRECVLCGGKWATEERPIHPDSYWSRAYSRNIRRVELDHKKYRDCTYCGTPYRHGRYREHCQRSQRHETALMQSGRNREHARRYQRKWKRERAA